MFEEINKLIQISRILFLTFQQNIFNYNYKKIALDLAPPSSAGNDADRTMRQILFFLNIDWYLSNACARYPRDGLIFFPWHVMRTYLTEEKREFVHKDRTHRTAQHK